VPPRTRLLKREDKQYATAGDFASRQIVRHCICIRDDCSANDDNRTYFDTSWSDIMDAKETAFEAFFPDAMGCTVKESEGIEIEQETTSSADGATCAKWSLLQERRSDVGSDEPSGSGRHTLTTSTPGKVKSHDRQGQWA
jgi:hypothetical protein